MFKQVISSTPLVSNAADSFFQNITGQSFNRDVTFLTTLRALVCPRMTPEERLTLCFSNTNYSVNDVKRSSIDRVLSAIVGDTYLMDSPDSDKGIIQIHNFTSAVQEDNYACLELVKSSFESRYSGWHRLEKITDFFRRTFYVLCFINPERRSVILFTDNMDIRKLHYLQCAIFAFLPWYFDPEAGVSELEMELINSLREKKPDKYEACIAKIAAQYDFRTQKIRSLLAGFETRYERIECERERENISGILARIETLNEEISDSLRLKAEKEIRLLGLETKLQNGDSGDSEIMEYFLCNKNLVLESVTDREMVFTCMGYLTYFDEDMAKRMIDNRRSFVYQPNGRRCNNYIKEDDMKKLMCAIFIDQTLRVKFCAAYQFRLDGNVNALSHHLYGYECAECTPNPHIDAYRCMGNYQQAINQLLTKNDYIGAIEQCVASCKSLNFADSTVMSEFMRRIYGIGDDANIRCIELPDGRIVAPKEAVEWLNAQEGENESDE